MSQISLLILCAGFGKRMLDLTIDTPKPLLMIQNKTLLSNSIDFFKSFGCNEIFINTHYQHKQIEKYINKYYDNKNISIIYEPEILGTGGAVKNIFKYTKNKNLCVTNVDIFWQNQNRPDIANFLEDYNKINYCKILLSKKNKFMGLSKSQGDFSLQNNTVKNWVKENDILYYSGFQILSKKIFENTPEKFAMNDVWDKLIYNNNLTGNLMNSKILHVGDKNTFDKL
tara:strand:- start:761 stop:1441 length:681 start_codon:yes stop_codon:yes gene_type:complete